MRIGCASPFDLGHQVGADLVLQQRVDTGARDRGVARDEERVALHEHARHLVADLRMDAEIRVERTVMVDLGLRRGQEPLRVHGVMLQPTARQPVQEVFRATSPGRAAALRTGRSTAGGSPAYCAPAASRPEASSPAAGFAAARRGWRPRRPSSGSAATWASSTSGSTSSARYSNTGSASGCARNAARTSSAFTGVISRRNRTLPASAAIAWSAARSAAENAPTSIALLSGPTASLPVTASPARAATPRQTERCRRGRGRVPRCGGRRPHRSTRP